MNKQLTWVRNSLWVFLWLCVVDKKDNQITTCLHLSFTVYTGKQRKCLRKYFEKFYPRKKKIFFSFFVSYGSNAPVVIQPDWEKNSRCFQGPLLNFQGVKLAIMPINHEKNYCMATNKYWLLTKL